MSEVLKYYALLVSGATPAFKKISRRRRAISQSTNPPKHHHRRHRISSRRQAIRPPFETVNTPAINTIMSFTLVIFLSLELWKFGAEIEICISENWVLVVVLLLCCEQQGIV